MIDILTLTPNFFKLTIKSNLSRPYTFKVSPKKKPRWKNLGHRDNYLQLYLHITNSENNSTVKILFFFFLRLISYSSLVYFRPLVKDTRRTIYSSRNLSFQTGTTFKCILPPLFVEWIQ